MHNRHHHYNHIHTLPSGVQSFGLVDNLVLGFSSYKLCQNDAGFHTGSKSCERRTLGSSWPVVSHIATASIFPSAVVDKIHLLVCFADR